MKSAVADGRSQLEIGVRIGCACPVQVLPQDFSSIDPADGPSDTTLFNERARAAAAHPSGRRATQAEATSLEGAGLTSIFGK